MNKEFKQGDKVLLKPGYYNDTVYNPLNTEGIIIVYSKGPFGATIVVEWSNGRTNNYDGIELILFTKIIYPDE